MRLDQLDTSIQAVRLISSTHGDLFLLTWGNVYDRARLSNVVRDYISRHGDLAGTISGIELCRTVGEAAQAPYFFEAFFEMARSRRRQVRSMWILQRRATARKMAEGREIWFLGLPTAP